MLVERHGSTWKLTPLGLHQLEGMPKATRMVSADPLELVEDCGAMLADWCASVRRLDERLGDGQSHVLEPVGLPHCGCRSVSVDRVPCLVRTSPAPEMVGAVQGTCSSDRLTPFTTAVVRTLYS